MYASPAGTERTRLRSAAIAYRERACGRLAAAAPPILRAPERRSR